MLTRTRFESISASRQRAALMRAIVAPPAVLAAALSAGCGQSPAENGKQLPGIRRAVTSGININPSGYVGGICLNGDCVYSTRNVDVQPGTYTLTAPGTQPAEGSTFARVTLAADGTLTDPDAGPLASHFVVGIRTLTAKTRQVTLNMNGYGGWFGLCGDVLSLPAPHNSIWLLYGRKYVVTEGVSKGVTTANANLSTSAYGLIVSPNGDAVTVDEDTGITLKPSPSNSTDPSTTAVLDAQTMSVQFQFNGYSGVLVPSGGLAYLIDGSGPVKMLRGRKYSIEAWYTDGINHAGRNISSAPFGFTVPATGNTIGLDAEHAVSMTAQGGSGDNATVSLNVADVVINPNGYPDSICVSNIQCSTPTVSMPMKLMAGRKYPIGGGGQFDIASTTDCGHQTAALGAYNVKVDCAAPVSVGLYLDPDGYQGGLCVDGYCIYGAAETIPVLSGLHTLTAPGSIGDQGTLVAHINIARDGKITDADSSASDQVNTALTRHFVVSPTSTALKARFAVLTVNFLQPQGPPYGGTLNLTYIGAELYNGRNTVKLLRDRKYALEASATRSDVANGTALSSAPYGLTVSDTVPEQVTLDADMSRSLSASTTDPMTVNVLAVPVTLKFNGYGGTIVPSGGLAYLGEGASTVALMRGRNYGMEALYTEGGTDYSGTQMSSQQFGFKIPVQGFGITLDENFQRSLTQPPMGASAADVDVKVSNVLINPNGYPDSLCIGNLGCSVAGQLWTQRLMTGRTYKFQNGGTFVVDANGNCSATSVLVGSYDVQISCGAALPGTKSVLVVRNLGTNGQSPVPDALVNVYQGMNPIGNGVTTNANGIAQVTLPSTGSARFQAQWWNGQFYSSATEDCSATSCPHTTIVVSGVEVTVVRRPEGTLVEGTTVSAYQGPVFSTSVASGITGADGKAHIPLPAGVVYKFKTHQGNRDFWSATDCAVGTCTTATIETGGECFQVADETETPCEDHGDICVGLKVCEGQVCVHRPGLPRPERACMISMCDPETGVSYVPDMSPETEGSRCDAGGSLCDRKTCHVGVCLPTPPAVCSVEPLFTCISKTGPVSTALLGYRNPSVANVSEPAGSELNLLTGNVGGQVQPSWFQGASATGTPSETGGTHPAVFSVDFETPFTWKLGDQTLAVSSSEQACNLNSPLCSPGNVRVGDGCFPIPLTPEMALRDAQVATDLNLDGKTTPGQTEGSFAVTDDGAATYAIPLWVPPGRAGMQPDLALRFSSRAGNGLLGIGWSVAGTAFSRIVRCNRTIAQDGFVAPVRFDSRDAFCLDSQRLVAVSGTYGAEGTEYRTERDTFTKITSKDIDALGPKTFEVRLKDGRILTYGKNPDALLQGKRVKYSGAARTPGDDARYAWGVSKVEDRADSTGSKNQMLISYTTDQAPLEEDYAHKFVPKRIDYTYDKNSVGNLKSVLFLTDAIPGQPTRSDVLSEYVSGFSLRAKERIRRIEMRAATKSGEPQDVVRSYDITYDADPSSNLSRIRSIQECDSAGKCKWPTKFQWQDGQVRFEEVPLPQITDMLSTSQSHMGADAYKSRLIQPIDVNGDGLDDILYRAEGKTAYLHEPSWFLRTSSGEAFSAAEELGINADIAWENRFGRNPHVADLQLDGKSDVALSWFPDPTFFQMRWHWYSPALSSVAPYVSFLDYGNQLDEDAGIRPAEFSTLADDFPVIFGDINGDAFPDVLRMFFFANGASTWSVRLNDAGQLHTYRHLTTTDQFPVPTPPPPLTYFSLNRFPIVVDLDGAGRASILLQTRNTPTSNPNWQFENAAYDRLDVGGEQSDPQAIQADRVYVSQRATNLNVYNPKPNGVPFQVLLGDFNGDGLNDVVTYEEGGEASLALNFGGDFTIPQRIDLPAGYEMRRAIVAADINQDGRQDLVLFGGINGVSQAKFLISTGDGFVPLNSPPQFPQTATNTYMLQQLLDVNGDGLLDLVEVESDNKLHLYMRRGKGNQLIGITEGVGAQTSIQYKAIAAPSVGSDCGAPRICPSRGVWVVSDEWINDGVARQHHLVHTFGQMAMDVQGRGFLGFKSHKIVEEATGTTRNITLDNGTKKDGTVYPFAGRPTSESILVNLESGRALWTNRKYEYEVRRTNGGKTYFASPKSLRETVEDLGSDVSTNTITTTITEYDHDDYGNMTREESVVVPRALQDDEGFADIVGERLKKTRTFDSDATAWLVAKQTSEVWSSTTPTDTSPTTRTTTLVPDPETGLLKSVTAEPDGDATMYLKRDFVREHGQITSVTSTDKAGNVREEHFTYDAFDGSTLSTVTNGLGHTTKLFFSPSSGVLAAQEDPNGLRTFWKYDGFGRPRSESRGDGGDLTAHYRMAVLSEAVGITVETQTVGGPGQATTYSGLGQPVSQSVSTFDGTLSNGSILYDQLHGKVATQSTLSDSKTPALTTSFQYDNAGRLKHQSTPDGNEIDYSYVGRDTTISDSAGRKRIVRVDALGRIAESVEVASNGTEIKTKSTYGAFGLLKTVTDAKMNTTTVTYDRLGRRLSIQDPDSGLTTFTPDAFGGIADTTDANHVKTVYTPDKLGRVRVKKIGTAIAETTWDTASHGIGRVASTKSFDGVVKDLTYDALGRPLTQSWKIDGEASREIQFGYDDKGRLERVDYPATAGWPRFGVSYGYTTSGYLKTATDANSGLVYWTAQSETAQGQILTESFGNNVTSTRSYDKGHLKDLIVTGPGGQVQNLSHEYWSTGNLKKRIDGINQITENFTYDEHDRLWKWYSNSPGWSVEYGYDEIGNLTGRKYTPTSGSVENLVSTYSGVNAGPHAVTSSAWGDYKYDLKGNQKETPDGVIDYTDFNLPKTITGKSGAASASFEYDGDDVRVVKRVTGPTTAKTVYVGGLYELRDDASHIFYVGAGGRTVAQVERTTVGGVAQETPFFLHDDHLGNVATVTDSTGHLVTDSTGQPVNRRKLDPFGNGVDLSNPALLVPGRSEGQIGRVRLGFTEQEQDFELGLVNMVGRLYSPKIGRFMTPDPFVKDERSQSLNRYSYVSNNPVNFTDPTGFIEDAVDFGREFNPGEGWTQTYFSSYSTPTGQTINVTWHRESDPSEGLGFGFTSFSSYGDPSGGSFGPPEVVSRVSSGGFSGQASHGGDVQVFACRGVSCGTTYKGATATDSPPVYGTGEKGLTHPFLDPTDAIIAIFTGGGSLLGKMALREAADLGTTTLFRAVTEAELGSIMKNGGFKLLAGQEGKWFATTLEGASQYAKMAYPTIAGYADSFIVRTTIETRLILPELGQAIVDRGISSVVVPGHLIPALRVPEILNYAASGL